MLFARVWKRASFSRRAASERARTEWSRQAFQPAPLTINNPRIVPRNKTVLVRRRLCFASASRRTSSLPSSASMSRMTPRNSSMIRWPSPCRMESAAASGPLVRRSSMTDWENLIFRAASIARFGMRCCWMGLSRVKSRTVVISTWVSDVPCWYSSRNSSFPVITNQRLLDSALCIAKSKFCRCSRTSCVCRTHRSLSVETTMLR